MNEKFKLYGYRWVVLGVFMFINLTIQTLWISFAPITGLAAEFYGVTDLQIGLLSMVFMIAFIPFSIPASWVIDTYGFRLAVGIGAVLMGIFGLVRGFAGANYSLVLWSTIGIAVAQPFLLNAWTTVPAKWFPVDSRATAVGLVTLANLVGVAFGMVLTPMLVETMPIASVQMIYGGIAAFSSVLFLILARETPPTPPCAAGEETRALMLDGLKNAIKIKPFWFFLIVSFIGLGIFNGLTTWVEAIIRPRGFTPSDAGTLGALMIAGGIFGCDSRPGWFDLRRFSLVALPIRCAVGIFPGQRHADRHAVCGGDHLSNTRRDLQRFGPALRTGSGSFCLYHGSYENFRRVFHSLSDPGALPSADQCWFGDPDERSPTGIELSAGKLKRLFSFPLQSGTRSFILLQYF